MERLIAIENCSDKTKRDFDYISHCEALRVGHENHLIRNRLDSGDIRCITPFEEVYEVVSAAHGRVGHRGNKKKLSSKKSFKTTSMGETEH